MTTRPKALLRGLALAGLSMGLGLLVSCHCSYCEVLEGQAAAAPSPAASYTDAVTTVGTSLSVVPVRTGAPISSSAVSTGTLPPGMTLGSDGSITGTPTLAGVYPLQIQLCSGGQCIVRPVTITVNAATSDPINAQYVDAATTVGTPLTVTPTILVGGPTSAALLAQGQLPAGMGLNATTGVISGTPTAAGVYPVSVDFANVSGAHVVVPVTLTVSQTGTTALAATYVDATGPVGTALSVAPTVTTGAPVVGASRVQGSIPPGMILNADGMISGVPTTPGTYPAKISLRNASGALTTPSVTLTITASGGSPLVAGYTNVTTLVGSVLNIVPTLSSGGPAIGAQVASGSLPPGLTLNPDGTLTGTATTQGLYTLEVRLCNASGGCTTVPLTVLVNNLPLTLAYATPQTFAAGTAIAGQVPALGHPAPTMTTTYAVTTGVLPTGLAINPDGSITGTPSAPGVYPFTVTATNGVRTATASVVYTVTPAGVLTVNYPTPQIFTQGVSIGTQTPTLVNETPGLATTFAVTAGSLPGGLQLHADGTITGTPSVPGVFVFAITATNGARTALANLSYTVTPAAALTLSYPTPLFFTAGTLVPTQTQTLGNATPGVATTYAVTTGALPLGLILNPGGTITGTPTVPGVYPFTVTATNGTRTAAANAIYTVEVAATLSLSYATPLTFTQGTPITVQNPTLGNETPGVSTVYSVVPGTLPPGLALNSSTGQISGTPTTLGVYPFTVTATNGTRAATANVSYTVVAQAPTALHYATPQTYTVGTAISSNLPNPTGGTPVTYTVESGSLPSGLLLNASTGAITGTPSAEGTFTLTIRGTNTGGYAEQVISITVVAAPTASLASNPSQVPVGQSSSLTAIFTGSSNGTAVISGGNLSGPVTLTSGTSLPTGIEASPASYSYTLTVTNAAGQTASSSTTVQWIPVPADTWTVDVPPGGGGPYAPDPGNLLNGQITVTVPNQGQSTCGSVTLTVNKEASLPGAILASARDYSNTFNIASNLGYPFRVPITITLKYDPTLSTPNLGASELPVPFYWDPSYNKWVSTGFKSIDTVNHTVTFTTLLPGRYAVLGIPGLTLASQSLGFTSTTDDWLQNNPSVYDLPGGASLGMGSFASWYFPFRKSTNGNTGLYNVFPTLNDANAQALISRIANGTMDSWQSIWNQQAYTLTNRQTGLALITGLMVTGQPQVFLMADARPAVNAALATAVYGYNTTTGKFNVMDPNYPGNALTIAWNSTTGAFSAYDRAAGYSPALAQFAFEGQTSVHRLADYDRVFSGAAAGFPTSSFATVAIDNIAGQVSPDITQTVSVASANNVTVSGTVTNGDENATHIFWSQNGSAPRTLVPLSGNSFSFTIPALADPYGTTVALETSATPCDPTFSRSGFQKFVVKQTGLSPWFPNICFEDGTTNPWVLQQSTNVGTGYRYPMADMAAVQTTAAPTWNATGEISNYNVTGTWNTGSADSALVSGTGSDAHIPAIKMVLDGTYAFRVNDPVNGSHLSRLFQTILVPATVAAPKLSFYWAAVLEDPGHPASEQPFVDVLVQDLDDMASGHPAVLYYAHFYGGDQTYPGWIVNGGWKGIPWQKVSLNLGTTRSGHHLKVTVTAADCTRGGHGGIAYIDSIGCQ